MPSDEALYLTFTDEDEPMPGMQHARYLNGTFALSRDKESWQTVPADHSWWQEALVDAAAEPKPAGALPQGREST